MQRSHPYTGNLIRETDEMQDDNDRLEIDIVDIAAEDIVDRLAGLIAESVSEVDEPEVNVEVTEESVRGLAEDWLADPASFVDTDDEEEVEVRASIDVDGLLPDEEAREEFIESVVEAVEDILDEKHDHVMSESIFDDVDYEDDPDVRIASKDKRQAEFERRNRKTIDYADNINKDTNEHYFGARDKEVMKESVDDDEDPDVAIADADTKQRDFERRYGSRISRTLWNAEKAEEQAKTKPLTESVDDEDPDVAIADSDARQRDFERRYGRRINRTLDKAEKAEEQAKTKPLNETAGRRSRSRVALRNESVVGAASSVAKAASSFTPVGAAVNAVSNGVEAVSKLASGDVAGAALKAGQAAASFTPVGAAVNAAEHVADAKTKLTEATFADRCKDARLKLESRMNTRRLIREAVEAVKAKNNQKLLKETAEASRKMSLKQLLAARKNK